MNPIILPPKDNPAWTRAEQIVKALRRRGEQNPFVVGAVANAFAESMCEAFIQGDHDQSFGPWQINFKFGGAPILAATGIDIRSKDTTLEEHVDALLWLLSSKPYQKIAAEIDAATNGADATRAFVVDFERAGAPGAVERRVAIAGQIEVWLASLK